MKMTVGEFVERLTKTPCASRLDTLLAQYRQVEIDVEYAQDEVDYGIIDHVWEARTSARIADAIPEYEVVDGQTGAVIQRTETGFMLYYLEYFNPQLRLPI